MGLLRFPFANELSPLPDGPMTQWASGIGFSFFFFLGRVVSAFWQLFRYSEQRKKGGRAYARSVFCLLRERLDR